MFERVDGDGFSISLQPRQIDVSQRYIIRSEVHALTQVVHHVGALNCCLSCTHVRVHGKLENV